MPYECKILLDSVTPWGERLTTFEVRFPRLVLAEWNTHRALSRNASSSRAIPTDRLMKSIDKDPAMPVWWGKNQRNMVAEMELDGEELEYARTKWLEGKVMSLQLAKDLRDGKLHKQIANRVLEPWMYCTIIVTATEWTNFFSLRTAKDTQPEIREIVNMMVRVYYTTPPPRRLEPGQWHLPYIEDEEIEEAGGLTDPTQRLRKISAARCARVSLINQDGKRDQEEDLKLHDRIWAAPHASPFEHPCTPFSRRERDVRKKAQQIIKRMAVDANLPLHTVRQIVGSLDFNGNIRGWTQLRKMLPGENRVDFDPTPLIHPKEETVNELPQ